jgi:GTP-binding protein YchF
MSLSIGIVGLPNVGKSTLFNALTEKSVPAENFPFCTIDPSVGVVAVPDPRLAKLSEFSKSAKTIPAAVEFVDIAGLVKGASEGEGLGNKFLSHIREVDAIAQVVRIFEDNDILHVSGRVEPLDDIEVINLELAMADLETAAKRRGNLEKELKRGAKEAKLEADALDLILTELRGGRSVRYIVQNILTDEQKKMVTQLTLLTAKPILYVLNRKGTAENLDDMSDGRYERLMEFLESEKAQWVKVDAGIESELRELSGDDKVEFRRELGVFDDGVNTLIRAGYELLGLMTYFTTGEDETRAWTIKRGSTAPVAGTAIHTDFKDKFIRAEVIAWDKLLEAGSYAVAREKGWVRTEGKEYIVQDGDVIEFKI